LNVLFFFITNTKEKEKKQINVHTLKKEKKNFKVGQLFSFQIYILVYRT